MLWWLRLYKNSFTYCNHGFKPLSFTCTFSFTNPNRDEKCFTFGFTAYSQTPLYKIYVLLHIRTFDLRTNFSECITLYTYSKFDISTIQSTNNKYWSTYIEVRRPDSVILKNIIAGIRIVHSKVIDWLVYCGIARFNQFADQALICMRAWHARKRWWRGHYHTIELHGDFWESVHQDWNCP